MTAASLLIGTLWLAPSYMLHTAMHEGSHAAVAVAGGAEVSVDLLPTRRSDGGWDLARTYHSGLSSPGWYAAVSLAPAVTSSLWMIGAAIAFKHTRAEWLRTILAVEMASALIDLGNWSRSAWQPYGDAHSLGSTLGWSPTQTKLITLAMPLVTLGIVWLILR
jgi:hypothetical protein